eukprot:942281-Karenia_brevis.AAC.2
MVMMIDLQVDSFGDHRQPAPCFNHSKLEPGIGTGTGSLSNTPPEPVLQGGGFLACTLYLGLLGHRVQHRPSH